MVKAKKTQQGKICQMCGNIGWADEIATCCHCIKVSEHIYCMKNQLFEIPTLWYCEECLSSALLVRGAQNASKRQRIGDESCFSFQTSKGLVKQSFPLSCSRSPGNILGDNKKQSGVPHYTGGSPKMPKNYSIGKATMVGFSQQHVMMPSSSKTISRTGKARKTKLLPIEEVASLKYNAHGSLSGSFQQTHVGKSLPCSVSRRTAMHVSGSADSNISKELSQTIKRPTDGDRYCSSKCMPARIDSDVVVQKMKDLGTAFCTDSEKKGTGFQERNLPMSLVICPDASPHTPKACWKGDFDVFHVASHVYSGIRAHFSGQMSIKVYDIAKRLPETIRFKVIPREDVWPQVFQLHPPIKEDIALYFFPCEEERHKEKYIRYLKLLDSGDLAMRTCVNGVELLVFLSKLLPVESQRIDGEIYCWGIFHHVKHKKFSHQKLVQLPSIGTDAVMRNNYCAQLDIPSQRNRVEGDMVENQNIQKSDISMIDVANARGFPIPTSRNLNYDTQSAVKIPMKNTSIPIDPDIPPGFSSLRTPRFSGLPRSQHPSNSHETTCKSPRPPSTQSRGHDTNIGDYAPTAVKPHEVSPKSHKLQKAYADIDSPPDLLEPNASDSNNVKSSLVKVPFRSITNPNDPDVPPAYSELEPPGFPQLPRNSCSSSSPHTSCPMPLLLDCGRQEHSTISVGFPPTASIQQEVQQHCHQEVGGSSYPDIPPGFSKLGPPGLPKHLSSPNHPVSSSETPCKAPRFSKNDWSDDVPSTTMGGYGSADSELNDMQPNLPQASDYRHKTVEHLRSHHPTNLAKDVKGFNSTKLHSTSENLSSSASKENASREKPATSNKISASTPSSEARRGCDFIERGIYRHDTLKRDTRVRSDSTNLGYTAAKEKGKSEMNVTLFDKSEIREGKGKQENGGQGKITELQECSKITHERNTKSITRGADENDCIKKTASLSKVVSGNLPTSFVSGFYDSTPNSPSSPLSAPHTGTERVNESNTSFSVGYSSSEDLEGTQKMKCQRLLEPNKKDLSLVSVAHASHSSLLPLFPEEGQSIRARVAENSDEKNDLELSVGRSVPWITPDISLSRSQYVKDGNVWISKSSRDRLKREGCGNELRL